MSEKNLYENEDPTWKIHMETLMKRKKNMEIAQTIDNALYEWYSERGLNVPKWKQTRDIWWQEYLISLGIDPRNP
jgi:hypothetical protein